LPYLQGEEKYRTERFKETALIYETTEASFQKAAASSNRIRHQEEAARLFERSERQPKNKVWGYKIILSKKRASFVKKIDVHKKASLKASLQILFLSTCLLWGYPAQASDILIVTESLPPYRY
jgi:hypothetical protein